MTVDVNSCAILLKHKIMSKEVVLGPWHWSVSQHDVLVDQQIDFHLHILSINTSGVLSSEMILP